MICLLVKPMACVDLSHSGKYLHWGEAEEDGGTGIVCSSSKKKLNDFGSSETTKKWGLKGEKKEE